MMEELKQWLADLNLSQTYTNFTGEWVEDKQSANKFYLVVRQDGGSAPFVDVRNPRFGIVLIGRRNTRSDAKHLYDDANAIMQAVIDGVIPCGSANITAMGEPVGPGFTNEGRAFYQLNLQVTF